MSLRLAKFLLLLSFAASCAQKQIAPQDFERAPANASPRRIIVNCSDLFRAESLFSVPHGQGQVSKSSYYYGEDANGEKWVSGRTHFSGSMVEVWLEGPGFVSKSQLHEQIVDYLAKFSLSDLPEGRIGFEIHVREKDQPERVFHIIDWAKLLEQSQKPGESDIVRAQRNLAEDFIQLYSQRYLQGPMIPNGHLLRISPEIVKRTQEITRECLPRTTFLVSSKDGVVVHHEQSFARLRDPVEMETPYGKIENGMPGFTAPEHFALTGGMAVVFSSGPSERMPTETLHNRPRPRPEGEHWAEITRYVIEEESQVRHTVSTEMLETAIAMIAGKAPPVENILVDVNGHHAKKYQELGFEIVDTFTRFDGQENYHMVAKTSVALERIRLKKIADQKKRQEEGEAPPAPMNTQPQDLMSTLGVSLVSWGVSGFRTNYPYFFYGEVTNLPQLSFWLERVLSDPSPKDQKIIVIKAMISYLIRGKTDRKPNDVRLKMLEYIGLLCEELIRVWKRGSQSAIELMEKFLKVRSETATYPEDTYYKFLRDFFFPEPQKFPDNFLVELDQIRRGGGSEDAKIEAIIDYGHTELGMKWLWWPLHGDEGLRYFAAKILKPENSEKTAAEMWGPTYEEIKLWKKQRSGKTQDDDIEKEKRARERKRNLEQQRLAGKYSAVNKKQYPDLNSFFRFDGRSAVVVLKDGRLRLYDLDAHRELDHSVLDSVRWPFVVKPGSKIMVSKDQKSLIVLGRAGAARLDLEAGKLTDLSVKLTGSYRHAELSNDGRFLFLGGERGETVIFNNQTNKVVLDEKGHGDHSLGIHQSPDGQWVFIMQAKNRHVLFNLRSLKKFPLPDFGKMGINHLYSAVFSTDSKSLSISKYFGKLFHLDLETGVLSDHKVKGEAAQLFGTADGKALILTHDILYAKDQKPFQVFDGVTGEDLTPDFSKYQFVRPQGFIQSENRDKICFIDVLLQDSETVERKLYVYDLKKREMKVMDLDPQGNFLLKGFTPDGAGIYGSPQPEPGLVIYSPK